MQNHREQKGTPMGGVIRLRIKGLSEEDIATELERVAALVRAGHRVGPSDCYGNEFEVRGISDLGLKQI